MGRRCTAEHPASHGGLFEDEWTPWASPPPAALAAPPAITYRDALCIATAGRTVEGVAQRALTSSPSRPVAKTPAQTAAAALRGWLGCRYLWR